MNMGKHDKTYIVPCVYGIKEKEFAAVLNPVRKRKPTNPENKKEMARGTRTNISTSMRTIPNTPIVVLSIIPVPYRELIWTISHKNAETGW
jgi:hypothetical protein